MVEDAPSYAWVWLTLLAVIAQTLRTAGQKRMGANLQPITVTLARYIFGLPFIAGYVVFLLAPEEAHLPTVSVMDWHFIVVAAIAQIIATVLMLMLFEHRNFAVGVTYVRSEAILTAILGVLFFGELLDLTGWLAISLSAGGVMLMNVARSEFDQGSWRSWIWNRSVALGLSSGFLFAITSLAIRKVALSLDSPSYLIDGAVTLIYVIVVQIFLLIAYMMAREIKEFKALASEWRLGTFIGVTSALGSIGWFTAFAIQTAAIVKAFGQIELVFAITISMLFFGERSNRLELAGILLIGAGVVGLLLTR